MACENYWDNLTFLVQVESLSFTAAYFGMAGAM